MSDATGFVQELLRRKVLQTALVYTALAWAAIEVATTLLPVYGAGDTIVRLVVGVILLGLPVAIVVSWLFDFTPQGFRRDAGTTTPAPERGEAVARGVVIDRPPPAPATALVGRQQEVADVVALLGSDARVVTITGPGGTGKTRLAMAAAHDAASAFPGGVAFVELAAVTAAGDVVPFIAGALGVKEAETRTLAEGLASLIGDARVLLVLDNLEQVIDAASELAVLLGACPALRLLTTSRAPLRIAAEAEYALRPLSLPPAGEMPPLEDLETYAAIELFLERTRRARAGFRLTADNASAVLEICRRLDGLPLALELAAARLRTLEPDALLARLEHALDVLTVGARDLPERQRTLRATIDWSHSLLNEPEQQVFRRLAAFVGGWPADAVAHVCLDAAFRDTADAMDTFDSLIEKGLVRPPDDAGRFGMLETIREFAVERLAASGEDVLVRRRHADYFASLAAALWIDFRESRQVEAIRRADEEAANIEAALTHYHTAAVLGDEEAARRGLELCGDLWMQWHIRGLHIRAREWSRRFLDLPAAGRHDLARARALQAAAVASMTLGDVEASMRDFAEMDPLCYGRDPATATIGAIAHGVGHLSAGDIAGAGPQLVEAVRRARELGRPWELGLALSFLAIVEAARGDMAAARAHAEEAIPMQRAIDDWQGLGTALGALATVEAAEGRTDQALALYREALDAYHTCGDRPEEARILDALAWTLLDAGRPDEAREHFAASLRAYDDVGSVRGSGIALLGLAATHAAQSRGERAVRIAAAAATFAAQEGVANDYAKHTAAPRYLDAARASLDPAIVVALEIEGRALSVREVVRTALDPGDEALQMTAH
jgi:predicted ATPase/Tfp pilus assembly protein PilF